MLCYCKSNDERSHTVPHKNIGKVWKFGFNMLGESKNILNKKFVTVFFGYKAKLALVCGVAVT